MIRTIEFGHNRRRDAFKDGDRCGSVGRSRCPKNETPTKRCSVICGGSTKSASLLAELPVIVVGLAKYCAGVIWDARNPEQQPEQSTPIRIAPVKARIEELFIWKVWKSGQRLYRPRETLLR